MAPLRQPQAATTRERVARPFLSLAGISRWFPGVHALTDISLELLPGRGHALVGENGAGKSTLVKIISGMIQPSAGHLVLDGRQVRFHSPAEARRHGISLVPQELSLAPDRSVAENIFMGQLPAFGPLLRRNALIEGTEAALQRLGLAIDPTSRLGDHPPAVQQLVMIARGIASRSRLFILDEPTAALTDPEIERLFAVLKDLKASGAALLYVTHRLAELKEVVEDITVLRDGCVVARMSAQETNEHELVRAMIGRPIERFFDTHATGADPGRVLLCVEGLTRSGAFENISFSIRAGEIVGLAGLVGAGRTEVARAVFGIDHFDRGSVEVDGEALRIRSPRDAIAAGIVLVPEERKSQGLMLERSISDNIVLPHLHDLSTIRFFKERALRAYSRRVSENVGVKAASVLTTVRTLSGGNQQKVVLGRWLTNKPKIYILDEPTRGIDVQAKAEIYAQIGRLANEGAAVLVISSELPEVLGICQRVLVMRLGRLVAEVPAASATEQTLLQLAMVDEFLMPPKEAVTPSLAETSRNGAVLPLEDGPIGEPARTYRFAFLQANGDTEWDAAQFRSLLSEAARHPNVTVLHRCAQNDAGRQIQHVEEAVAEGVDAMILAPVSLGFLTPAVERAQHAGIPVVGMEGNIASRAYDCWIWPDLPNVVGRLGELLVSRLGGKGVVVEVPGPADSSISLLLHDELARVLKQHSEIRLVATRPTNGSEADSHAAVREFLAAGGRAGVWYVHHGRGARGVRRALDGRSGSDAAIFATDDGVPIVTNAEEGKLAAVAPRASLHADLAFRAAAYRVLSQPMPKDIVLPAPPVITPPRDGARTAS